MKSLLFNLILIFSYLPAQAGLNFSAFGGTTSGSSNSTFTAGYENEFDLNNQAPIYYYFSLQSGRSQFTTILVEGLNETQTKSTSYGISSGLTIMDLISVGYDYESGSVNSNAVLYKEYTISPAIHFKGFRFSYSYSKKKVSQNNSFRALNQEYKDEITFTQNSDRMTFGYQFTDNFSLSVSQTKFKYDKDMENAYSFLSTPIIVNNNGTDMLSQIYSLLDSSAELSGVYTVADRADIEISIGKTVDLYGDKPTSSDVRVGTMIYQTKNFTWGFGITATRSSSENTPSRSYDATVSLAF